MAQISGIEQWAVRTMAHAPRERCFLMKRSVPQHPGWKAFWVVLFIICWSGRSLAQGREALWTNNAFSISTGRFWCASPSSTNLSGPDRNLRIRGLYQWNLGVAYERHTRKRWSYGASFDLTQPFFTVEAEVDDPAQGMPPGSGTATDAKDRFIPVHYYMEIMAFAGIPVHVRDRWRLDAAVEAGVNPSWSTDISTLFAYSAPSDTGQVGIFIGALGAGLNIWPMLGLRLNGSYRLKSHDCVMLALEARMSATNFWEGGYNMYGFTDQRSEGEFKGHLAYIGFRMGYAFTWGGPRKPKWLRQQEEAEKAIGPPAR